MSPRLCFALAGLIALSNADLASGDDCQPTETVSQCMKRVATETKAKNESQQPKLKADAKRDQKDKLNRKNTGQSTLIFGSAGSATNDFTPVLNVSGDAGGVGNDKSSVLLEFNTPNLTNGYKFAFQAKEATLFEPLEQALVADGLDETAAGLRNDVSGKNNLKFTFSFNPTNRLLGRSIDAHSKLFDDLFAAAYELSSQDRGLHAQARKEYVEVEIKVEDKFKNQGHSYDKKVTTLKTVEDVAGEFLAFTLSQKAARASRLRVDRRASLRSGLKSAGIFQLADLVNNQPQLFVEFSGTTRDELVGPNELRGKVTYEIGWPNINSFRRYAKGNCSGQEDAACFGRFATQSKLERQLESSQRFALSLEYARIDSYEFSLPEDMFQFAIDRQSKVIASLSYNRSLPLYAGNKDNARLNMGISFEDVGDDPARNDRTIANLLVTQKLTEAADFTFGAIYTNKPEFIDGVEEDFTVNFGVQYKFLNNEE